jgi:hypothetical protein
VTSSRSGAPRCDIVAVALAGGKWLAWFRRLMR